MGMIDTVKEFVGSQTQTKAFTEGLNTFVQQSGGVEGLKSKFEKEGAGSIFQSWVGTGPNLPISKEQLEKVLGQPFIKEMAAKMGLDPAVTSEKLTHILPEIVNHLSPEGKLPAKFDTHRLMDAVKNLIKRPH